ncbi:UNVERIFIED_CONTAM: hypothetical protein K2H54_030798 [Gekko kuhli]
MPALPALLLLLILGYAHESAEVLSSLRMGARSRGDARSGWQRYRWRQEAKKFGIRVTLELMDGLREAGPSPLGSSIRYPPIQTAADKSAYGQASEAAVEIIRSFLCFWEDCFSLSYLVPARGAKITGASTVAAAVRAGLLKGRRV